MIHTIPIAHDFTCGWCYIGWRQTKILAAEYPIQFEWRAFELWPQELDWPKPSPSASRPNRPPTPSRRQFLEWLDGIAVPKVARRTEIRTHRAHEAVEHAKTFGCQDAMVDRLYEAYWNAGLDLESLAVLEQIGAEVLPDSCGMLADIMERRFAEKIVAFDEPAYEIGVYNVPTFFIGDERLAEQPLFKLRKSIELLLRSD